MKRGKNAALVEAKIRLYGLLLQIPTANMTDREIEMAYELSRDTDVQDHLDQAARDRRR